MESALSSHLYVGSQELPGFFRLVWLHSRASCSPSRFLIPQLSVLSMNEGESSTPQLTKGVFFVLKVNLYIIYAYVIIYV